MTDKIHVSASQTKYGSFDFHFITLSLTKIILCEATKCHNHSGLFPTVLPLRLPSITYVQTNL